MKVQSGVHSKSLKFSEKVALIINGTTGSFHSQMISMFLLFFYTDMMKISAGYVAVLFLVTRIADAFLSPAFGLLIDKITTPWGKYKPWYILSGILVGIGGWLTFTVFPFSTVGKLIYATVTYVIYSSVKAIGYGPQTAIIPAVTKKLNDRVSINQIGYIFMLLAVMLVQIGVQPLYKFIGGGDGARGFSVIMGIIAAISIAIGIFEILVIKERYLPPKRDAESSISLKETLYLVFTNKTAVISFLYTLGVNLATGIKAGVTIYYFKYYFGNENLVAVTGAIAILPTMLGVILSSKVTRHVGIKRNMVLGALVSMLSMAAVILIPPTQAGVILYILISIIGGIFTGFSTPVQGTLMPAAMDYTEWKSGKNINAFMGSINGFLQTFATAISGAVVAGVLSFAGYEGGVALQSSSTIMCIRILMSVVPAITMLLTFAVFKFDLTEERQIQIAKELSERKENGGK